MRSVSLILAAVGAVAGLSAVGIAWAQRASCASREELETAVTALRESDARHEEALTAATAGAVAARSSVRELAARVAALRTEHGTAPRSEADEPESLRDDVAATDAPARAAKPAAARLEELRELGERVLRDAASAEERGQFFRLAKEEGLVDALLSAAQAAVDAEPGSVAARMKLADSFLVKLYTVPGGPEQGVWGEKAEDQWKRVAELDPEHWDARFRLAESWSYYPDVMNRTADAIQVFERLREIQEAGAPEPRHARVYRFLHQLYLRQGEREKAEAALAAGARRHPDDAGLGKGVRR